VVRKLTDILAEQAKAEADDRDLRSRSDARRERKQSEAELVVLGRQLVEASDRQLDKLDLPEGLREVLAETRAIRSPSARKRALRLVRRELRDADASAIRAKLSAVGAGKTR
jgi:ribosomal 50S subunit-associated protein YjgA (DUF615 family)